MKIKKIYIDLDGVMTDFEGTISKFLGKHLSTISKGYMWATVNKINKEVHPFYENLPLMKDAMKLWDFVIDNFDHVEILTASGNTPKDVKEQKYKWVEKTLSGHKEVNVVIASKDKANFASADNILVDDSARSIDPWVEAGGIGILHTSVEDTINKLKQYI